ncbi:diacylglycerol kinase family protein [Endozoicomonas sp. 4G]|uniref:diacylglycerol/lipid kinase family protein n=1 Tax=Endozoicomonas sp. 4G TaxID=2872754 RepID=UPI0020790D80|nr:diacylglycerol kinase family protein [Endozoicomonas sp. 4G]
MNSRVFYLYGLLLVVFFVPQNGSAVIRHVCFIVNPASNNGQGVRVWESIHRAVNRYFTAVGSQDQAAAQVQTTFEVFFTEHAGHATELAAQASFNWQLEQESHLLIVAVGGDGTVHEVVQGLENQPQVVFGVIPAGEGNDIARTLRLRNPMHALLTLVYGVVMPFGAYKITGCERGSCERKTVLAVSEFGLGVTTWMTKKKNDHDSGERPSRLLRYLPPSVAHSMLAVSSAMIWDTPTVRCSINGERFSVPLNLLVAGTGPTIGGGVALFNGMTPYSCHGQMLFSQQRTNPLWTLIQMTMEKFLNWSGLQRFCFTQLDIEHGDETPLSIQVDGDVLLQTPAQITWLARVFQFMRPPVYGEYGRTLMDRDEARDDPDWKEGDSL